MKFVYVENNMHIQSLSFTILVFIGFIGLGFSQEISNSFENEVGSFFADQTEYEISRTSETLVKIHGQFYDVSRASKVVIIFTLPDGSKTGNHVFTTEKGEFETFLPLNRESQIGEYSVFVSNDGKILGQIGFTVKEKPLESPVVPKPKPTQEQNQTITETPDESKEIIDEKITEIPKDEGSYELPDGNLIYYSVSNGNLVRMDIDKTTATLSSSINSFGDGTITLAIPRHVLDAKENDVDVDFIVQINGNQVGYRYVAFNQYDRVIEIDTVSGFSQIEIIGTLLQEPVLIDKQILRVYVSDIPSWTMRMDSTIEESLEYWEVQYPTLDLQQVGKNDPQDFFVMWVKEFGVEHVGYAFQNKFIEVGLGDSNCRGKWQPYSPDHVGYILKHEIGHILGLGHDPDPNSIMYPVAQNREYGLETEDLVLTSGFARYIPLCTIKDSTSYDISVNTDDPTYGFNVYVVESENQFQNFIDGKPIEYVKDSSCYKENTRSFVGTCNVNKGNGILLTINDKQTKGLTNIKILLKEVSPKNLDESYSSKIVTVSSPICGAGTVERDGVCVPAVNMASQIGAREGQWIKYTLDIDTDSTNEFAGLLMEAAMSQAFQNSDVKLDDVQWIKSEITDISQGQITVQNSIQLKNEQIETMPPITQDLDSLSSINWVIPTDYQVGDVVYVDETFGEATVTGIKTKNYGKKTFEVIEVRTERTINEDGNVMLYKTMQNYDKKTGMMLETLLEMKMANILLGALSLNFHIKAIDSYHPNTESSGCLVATAAYGSELSSQVQLLREIRDNVLFRTNSGTAFMMGFNEFYYSFSPMIADLERQNPLFKEIVKTAITPMLSTLSILNYVDINSEQEVLGYGIGIILLNVGIYFVLPVFLLVQFNQRRNSIF